MLTSDASEVRHYDLWIFCNEHLGPEVLDEGIREEFEAHSTVVFSENCSQKIPVDTFLQVRNRLAHTAGEEQSQHLDDALIVL